MSTIKTTILTTSYLFSQMDPLNIHQLSSIVENLVPSATLGPVVEISSPQLPRLYELTLSDQSKLLLSFAPGQSVRLLRQEATLLKEEAMTAHFIEAHFQGTEREAAELGKGSRAGLDDLLPKFLKHSPDTRELALPYSIFKPVAGLPLSTMTPEVNSTERRVVDKKRGSMIRALANLKSPSARFGAIGRVLPDPYLPKVQTSLERKATKMWSEAFHSLLEGILRDGEDLAVLLPYEIVRAHYQRLSWLLDEVTVPRLVMLDARETNFMAERIGGVGGEGIRLTGLRCWSPAIFADPLICNAFEDPSQEFLEGWREPDDDIIEDADNADARMLLYRCYRGIVGIVTEYYRPRCDSSQRELECRRNLTSALKELENVDLDVRRP